MNGHVWLERQGGRVLVRSVPSYRDGPLHHECRWECDCGEASAWRGYCGRSGATTSPAEMLAALDHHIWFECERDDIRSGEVWPETVA